MLLYQLFIVDVLVPFCISLVFYKWIRKFLWCVPIIALIVMGGIFLKEVSSIGESGFLNKLSVYFSQDWSMEVTLIFLHVIVMSLIFTILFYMYDYIHRRKNLI